MQVVNEVVTTAHIDSSNKQGTSARKQIELIYKFISNPKTIFRHATTLQRAETGVSPLLGPNGPTNIDGDAANLLTKQHIRTFQLSHANYEDESITCNSTELLEVNWCIRNCRT